MHVVLVHDHGSCGMVWKIRVPCRVGFSVYVGDRSTVGSGSRLTGWVLTWSRSHCASTSEVSQGLMSRRSIKGGTFYYSPTASFCMAHLFSR